MFEIWILIILHLVSQAQLGDSHACNVGFVAVIAVLDFALLNTL